MSDGILSEYWSSKVAEAIQESLEKLSAPHVIMRPQVIKEGNAWMCVYGDLPTGVAGSGNTPQEACSDFDRAWRTNQ